MISTWCFFLHHRSPLLTRPKSSFLLIFSGLIGLEKKTANRLHLSYAPVWQVWGIYREMCESPLDTPWRYSVKCPYHASLVSGDKIKISNSKGNTILGPYASLPKCITSLNLPRIKNWGFNYYLNFTSKSYNALQPCRSQPISFYLVTETK